MSEQIDLLIDEALDALYEHRPQEEIDLKFAQVGNAVFYANHKDLLVIVEFLDDQEKRN